jgi:hypothetical protein
MSRRSLALPALALLLAPALAPAPAAGAASPYLWATVNRCDTAAFPNTIGIRASMPGNGTKQRMEMRFEAQFFDRRINKFAPTGSSSVWQRQDPGSARFKSTQDGFSFTFNPPPAGEQFVMRGRVDFRWRARRGRPGHRRWVTVKRRKRITRAGILNVEGGDPPGRSDALCVIR